VHLSVLFHEWTADLSTREISHATSIQKQGRWFAPSIFTL